jgi:NADP-dependent 3-hydroxy acid dehydrogenase YdfG
MDAKNDLKAQYGDRLWLAHLDVTDTPEIHQVVNKAFADLGKIDVVVNNAGYRLFGAAEELTNEQIAHQIDTNLIGSIQVVRVALPHLRAQGGGRIIQISTYSGQAALPGGSLYHAGKWGIEGFIDAVGQEVATFNIGVTLSSQAARAQTSGSEAPNSVLRWTPIATLRPGWFALSSRTPHVFRKAIQPRWSRS